MKIDKIRDRIIQKDSTILDALKWMDAIDKKLLFVFNDDKFVSLLSIGDIQRAIIKNYPLNDPVVHILRKKIRVSSNNESFDIIKKRMFDFRMECMPVLDSEKNLVNVYFWEDVFSPENKRIERKLGLPVVIMAGGKGERLKPITNVLPKSLIPIGDKTILEHIMDRFVDVGCNNFYLSLNYKADMIKYYISQLNNNSYRITYLQEDQALGTAGSLYLVRDKINSTFFVSNCDIIVDDDYSEIYAYHQKEHNDITIIVVLKHYRIPYGTIETSNNGRLSTLYEKPEFTFKINSGLYILEPHVIQQVPENEFFHITQLIENIKRKGGRIGVFPVSEGSWRDIGEWDEYLSLSAAKPQPNH